MKHFIIYEKDFDGAALFTARAGTNGLQGGDAGHGGQAIIDLIVRSGDFNFILIDGIKVKTGDKQLKIIAAGDSEIELLVRSLEWCCKTLRDGIELNRKS